jgi:hypothetical protein
VLSRYGGLPADEAIPVGPPHPSRLPQSRAAWRIGTLVAFAGSGGYEYQERMRDDPPGEQFGIVSLVSWINSRVWRGLNPSFDAALRDPAIRQFLRVRAAIGAVGVAMMLERHLFPDQTPDCLIGRWQLRMPDLVERWDALTPKPGDPPSYVRGGITETFDADGRWRRDHSEIEMKVYHESELINIIHDFRFSGHWSGFYAFRGDEGLRGDSILCRCIDEDGLDKEVVTTSKLVNFPEQVTEDYDGPLPEMEFKNSDVAWSQTMCAADAMTTDHYRGGFPALTYDRLQQ